MVNGLWSIVQKRFRDFVRNPHARQVLIGIGIALLFGIDDRKGRRQFGRGVVMIRDHQVQPDVPRVKRLVRRTDAAVHGDDQSGAVRFQLVQRLVVQAIAFVEAVGYVTAHVRAEALQGLHEQGGGRHAVHIVISVDGDRFVTSQREADAIRRRVHVLDLEGVGVEVRPCVEEGTRFGVGGVAAVEKKLPQNRWEGGQVFLGLRRDGGRDEPAFLICHGSSIRWVEYTLLFCHVASEQGRKCIMDARAFMYTLGPDEKATLVMLYTPSMLARGELVTKQHIRVNMWLRSAGLPNYIHLHKAEVLVFGGGAPKPLTYAEIFVPAVQVSGFHLVPPATEPLDYDVNEANRAMHPMSLLLGSFVIKGKTRTRETSAPRARGARA